MAAMTTMGVQMPAGLGQSAFRSGRPTAQRSIRPCLIRCTAQRHTQQTAAKPAGQPAAKRSAGEHDALLLLTAALAPLFTDVGPAAAGNPLLTGKTISLVHPAAELAMLGVTIYTGILGWNYRTSRLIPAEVKELKAQLPKDEEAAASSPIQAQIKELQAKRKQLTEGDPRAKHFLWSSLLLGVGTTFGIIGPLNTYLRTGKLFPGPHLYAGLGLVVLWAIAASMVPLMSRNNDTARSVHIGANALSVGLFLWQVPTGFEIVQKVWEFAPWP